MKNLTEILNLDSSYQIFSYFFDNDLIDHICEETLKYSLQKNVEKPLKINKTDFKRFLGITIMISVQKNPSIRSYWSSNIGNDIIKNTMPVNMFEKIKIVYILMTIPNLSHSIDLNMIEKH